MPVTDVVPAGVDADLATNASADLLMLQKLNPSETFAYISERPYLTRFFCRCGPPFEVARSGVGYIPDDRRIFADLTVEENLRIVRQVTRRDGRWTLDGRRLLDRYDRQRGLPL